MHSRRILRQWAAGLLAEITAYALAVVVSSLIALVFAGLV
jgi:hypothetical protein